MKNSVYKDAFRVSAIVFLLGMIEFIAFTVFVSFRIDIISGILYGCIFACANFFYLAYSVIKSVENDKKGAQMHMAGSYTVRLLLTAAMVIIAARVGEIHFWAAIIPLLFPRLAVHLINLFNFIRSHKNEGSENS